MVCVYTFILLLFFKEAEEERLARREVEFRAQKFSLQVDNMREKLEQGDYKSSTYDQVKMWDILNIK